MQKVQTMPKDDVWVQTLCDMCNNICGTLVHRVDGVVVDIKGDPNSPYSRGKLCAKGYSAIMGLYDPHRVKTPLKRTNPEKGLGVDPGWVRVSWKEALDIVEKELTRVRKDDPRKLTTADHEGGPRVPLITLSLWADAFSGDKGPVSSNGGYFCGNYFHSGAYIAQGTHRTEIDPENLNYLISVGRGMGFGSGHNFNSTAQKVAEARKRGMKVVVVDPLCNNAGAKADEWLPIRPGTDGALILSMINVLLNELGIYDREFIKRYTNGPYLVKPDGYYARREGKPLVWDAKEGTAKTYDADVKDYAIDAPERSYVVDGVECLPAFQLLKRHVKKYTPEMAAEITTIPADTIRRVAGEFGKEARIGSTIVIEGKELPYRPAVITQFRGAGAHKHGFHVGLAVFVLNQIVGSYYVPGGLQGIHLVGPSWRWQPRDTDGLMRPHAGEGGLARDYYNIEVKAPESHNLEELYPMGGNIAANTLVTVLEAEKYKLPQPEVLLVNRRNLFLSGVNHEITASALKKYRFIFAFVTHLDEAAAFADLVLPEVNNLEECGCGTTLLGSTRGDGDRGSSRSSPMTGHWCWAVRQPVVPPLGEARHMIDVLMELAERMGFLGDVYQRLNKELKKPYKLDISKKYSLEEIHERHAKTLCGEEKGLKWFKQNGWLNIKMAVDERYPLPWLKVRFPIYFENVLRAGKEVKEVTERLGYKDWDVSDYTALLDWKPCPAYNEVGDFDLIAFNFRVPTHSFSWTAQNAWLAELAEFNPYAQGIIINSKTARSKGIKDKDKVCVESRVGKVVGVAKVTECVHPETVGMSGHFGSLAKGKPIAYGKGVNFNNLLPLELETLSPGVDSCVRVKVYKV